MVTYKTCKLRLIYLLTRAPKPRKQTPSPTCPFIYINNVKEPGYQRSHPIVADSRCEPAGEALI
jgi:hypothetical protein